MSAFTDAMTAVVAAIKAGQGAVDPAHLASLDTAVAGLQAAQTTLTASQQADEATIASHTDDINDIKAGLKVLTDGLAATA